MWRKMRRFVAAASAMSAVIVPSSVAMAGGGSDGKFTYQGRLLEAGAPVAGPVNVAFRLYDAATAGNQAGPELVLIGFEDFDGGGLFTVDLNFGAGAFSGAARWLEIWIDGAPLSPRQPVYASPYAQYAHSAATAAMIPDGGLGPTYTSPVSFTSAGNSFAGSGAGLTNLSAASVTSGKLGAAFMPTGGGWALSGDLNVDGGTLFLDPADDTVSIGHPGSPPFSKFLVAATGTTPAEMRRNDATTNAPVETMLLNAGTTGAVQPGFGNRLTFLAEVSNNTSSAAGQIDAVWIDPGIANRTSAMIFRTLAPSDNGTPKERVRIDHEGNVGIGTSTPAAKLHVVETNPAGVALEVTGAASVLEQEPWQAPVLLNSWEHALPGTTNPPGFMKDSMGFVHFRGALTGGTLEVMFVLPPGYRTEFTEVHLAVSDADNWAFLNIEPTGEVEVFNHTGSVFLDGVTFRAAN